MSDSTPKHGSRFESGFIYVCFGLCALVLVVLVVGNIGHIPHWQRLKKTDKAQEELPVLAQHLGNMDYNTLFAPSKFPGLIALRLSSEDQRQDIEKKLLTIKLKSKVVIYGPNESIDRPKDWHQP